MYAKMYANVSSKVHGGPKQMISKLFRPGIAPGAVITCPEQTILTDKLLVEVKINCSLCNVPGAVTTCPEHLALSPALLAPGPTRKADLVAFKVQQASQIYFYFLLFSLCAKMKTN